MSPLAFLARLAVCAYVTLSTGALAAPFAYVGRSTSTDDSVVVIDTATNTVVATIPIDAPAMSVAVSPSGRYAYVAHWLDDHVSVIDLTTNRVISRISISAPMGIAFDAAETRAYVSSMGTYMPGTTVSVIDMTTRTVTKVADGHYGPTAIVLNHSGTRIFIGSVAGLVTSRDAVSLASYGSIDLGAPILGMAISPSGTRLYASHVGSATSPINYISVVDLQTSQRIATVTVGQNPLGLSVDPSGAKLFVANTSSNSISVVDTSSNRVVATIPADREPMAVGVHPSGSAFYVINDSGGTLSVFDARTYSRISTIPIGGEAVGLASFVGPYTAMGSTTPGILSGIWFNPSEGGWGVQLTHRRDNVFATWYTYDESGNAKWYAMDTCRFVNMACPTCVAGASCVGDVYETTGPHGVGMSFDPNLVRRYGCGDLRIDFQTSDKATLTYTVSGQSRTVPIQRYVFRAPPTMPAIDYTDMWWNPAESGWGLSVTHQQNTMFLAWYVYDPAGKPTWYAVSNCTVSGNACTGELHRYSGPPWGPTFNAGMVAPALVGMATAAFSDRDTGVLSYTVDGIGGSKPIRRFVF
jgi:YVTN family beta-propeller protein